MTENKRPTVYDVAVASGVSVSTVTRALNDKKDISENTKNRVLKIADEIGFKATVSAQRMRQRTFRIAVLLQCRVSEYLEDVYKGVCYAAEELRNYNVDVITWKFYSKEKNDYKKNFDYVMEKLENMKIDAFVYFPVEMNECVNSRIEKLHKKGIVITSAVVRTDVFDICIATNAMKAGMMAAEFLEQSCSGKKAAAIIGPSQNTIHTHNKIGFYNYGKNCFSDVIICEQDDTVAQATEKTNELLKSNPDLAGLYISSAISPVVCRCISDCFPERNIKIVATDLFEDTLSNMKKGIVSASIFQNPYQQGYLWIDYTYKYLIGKISKGTYLYRPEIILRSNCDLDFRKNIFPVSDNYEK